MLWNCSVPSSPRTADWGHAWPDLKQQTRLMIKYMSHTCRKGSGFSWRRLCLPCWDWIQQQHSLWYGILSSTDLKSLLKLKHLPSFDDKWWVDSIRLILTIKFNNSVLLFADLIRIKRRLSRLFRVSHSYLQNNLKMSVRSLKWCCWIHGCS